MSYIKTIWVDNDLITASKMNKIENELAHSSDGENVLIVNEISIEVDGQLKAALDKNYEEISNALLQGKTVISTYSEETDGKIRFSAQIIDGCAHHDNIYGVGYYLSETSSGILINSTEK